MQPIRARGWFPNSHADVFISRLLDGYRLNGAWHARVAGQLEDEMPIPSLIQ